MPFCWMEESEETSPTESGSSRQAAIETEIRERAALMRRLGYSKTDTLHRCMGNVAWAFSVSGKPAVTPARVRKIVAEAYGKAS